MGSGITREPTALSARLLHAAVQLLRAADEPPEALDGDWQNLLYGHLSEDDSDDLDGGALGGGGRARPRETGAAPGASACMRLRLQRCGACPGCACSAALVGSAPPNTRHTQATLAQSARAACMTSHACAERARRGRSWRMHAKCSSTLQGRTVDVDPAAVLALADAGGEDESAEQWKGDPLLSADVGGAAVRTLIGIMHADRAFFDAALRELNKEEAEYLHGAFAAHAQGQAAHA